MFIKQYNPSVLLRCARGDRCVVVQSVKNNILSRRVTVYNNYIFNIHIAFVSLCETSQGQVRSEEEQNVGHIYRCYVVIDIVPKKIVF